MSAFESVGVGGFSLNIFEHSCGNMTFGCAIGRIAGFMWVDT